MAQSSKLPVSLLTAVMLVCTAWPASAQAPPPTHAPRNDAALKPAPVRPLLRLLFTSVGQKYVLDNDVQGMTDPVGALSDGPFTYLLDTLIDYTTPSVRYDIKNDVYYFHRKYIPTPEEVQPHITLHYAGPVREVLKALFQQAGLDADDLRINPGVQANVTIDLKDVSFATALNTLLTTAKPILSYRLKGRYLVFVPPSTAPLPPKTSR